jgi:SAM-dependent methyltransferase
MKLSGTAFLRSRFDRFRWAFARHIYRTGPQVLASGAWRLALLESVRVPSGARILDFGSTHARVAAELTIRFPEASVTCVAWETSPGVLDKWAAASPKVTVSGRSRPSFRVAADGASFDVVISPLAMHSLDCAEKVALLQEMYRLLRRGGTAYWAEIDAPQNYAERAYLTIAGADVPRLSLLQHLDGSWIDLIANVGFKRVIRLASLSCTIARVAIVCARR